MELTHHRITLWFAKHWVWVMNTFFIIYFLLPLLAPIFLTLGWPRPASAIYWVYGFTCHQLPSHSYFIFGKQVAICERCLAIHASMALVGVLYGLALFRPPVLRFRWYLLFFIPIAMDGGMSWVSELLVVVPIIWFWGIGLAMIAIISLILLWQKLLVWQAVVFLAAGPASLLAIQIFGPHQSDWLLRTITGFIYAAGTIWFMYPLLAEGFRDMQRQAQSALTQAH